MGPDPPPELLGRAADLEVIRTFLQAGQPPVLMLRGEPGVGKSALVDAAAGLAEDAGTRVLRATGTEFEVGVSFAGLSQALLPLQEHLGRLSPRHHASLSAALGLGDGAAQDLQAVADGVAALLGEVGRSSPVVLLVDDVPWIDRATADVLNRLVRSGTGVRLLLAGRTGEAGLLDSAVGLVHDVVPLGEQTASQLIRGRFPDLAVRVRRRLLAEAAGNPLALLELPAALGDERRTSSAPLPGRLPLPRRLGLLYAERIQRLPSDLRRLLLMTAVHDGDDLRPLFRAVAGDASDELLATAADADLLVASPQGRVAFRHPLVRAGLVAASTGVERRQAHRDVAGLLADQPERRAWHLAEASVEPDAEVSALLEQTARRTRARGDAVGAVTAMLRSADLTPHRSERARRLTQAAYLGADVTGELSQASRLLRDAREVDPQSSESLQAATAAAYLLLNGDGDVGTAHRLLAGALETEIERGRADPDDLAEALHNLLEICLYGNRPELWRAFDAVAGRVSLEAHPLLQLWVSAMADPVRTAGSVLGIVDELLSGMRDENDLTRIERVAAAMIYLDRVDDLREPLYRVVADGRLGGAVTAGINALMLLSLDAVKTGRWQEAAQLADEGVELCERHGYSLLAWPFALTRGLLAAGRGRDAAARAVADDITTWAAPRRVFGVRTWATHIRLIAALTRGDAQAAYEQAVAINPPGRFLPHTGYALWVCMDLVEAAVRADRHAEAAAHVTAMHEAGIAALSSRLALLVAGSTAMVAGEDAPELFEQALRTPQADRWPFDLARIRLFYGERLRRTRHPAAARGHLEQAEAAFRRLGATPWAERARAELLATSPTKARTGTAPGGLTPQEHVVAGLAAVGLSNKQIGERLRLSPRTVAAHLRSVFRKLNVPARAGLRDGLDRASRPVALP